MMSLTSCQHTDNKTLLIRQTSIREMIRFLNVLIVVITGLMLFECKDRALSSSAAVVRRLACFQFQCSTQRVICGSRVWATLSWCALNKATYIEAFGACEIEEHTASIERKRAFKWGPADLRPRLNKVQELYERNANYWKCIAFFCSFTCIVRVPRLKWHQMNTPK